MFDLQSTIDPHEIEWTPAVQQTVMDFGKKYAQRVTDWWHSTKRDVSDQQNVSVWRSQPRADATWLDTVEALFKVPTETEAARSAYVRDTLMPQLQGLQSEMKREKRHSYDEMTRPVEQTKGLIGLDDELQVSGMSHLRNSVVSAYRNDQKARHQWLDAMERQVEALLANPRLLATRQSATFGFYTSWNQRDPMYQRG